MLALIARGLGWEGTNETENVSATRSESTPRKKSPRKRGEKRDLSEWRQEDFKEPTSKGKHKHSIIVNSKENMYIAAQTLSSLLGGKVMINKGKT